MRILTLYIGKAILSGAFLTLIVLVALDVLFTLIDEFEDVGKGVYTYADALLYLGLSLPHSIYELFPAAVLVGSLLSLGALASNSELIAMRAAGISIPRIVWATVQTGLVLLLLVALIGEFLVPPAERWAQTISSKKQGLQVSTSVDQRLWIRSDQDYIEIGNLYPDLRLEDVYIHRFAADNRLQSSTHVRSLFQQGDYWELRDVQRTRFIYQDTLVLQQEQAEVERWPSALDSELITVLTVEPSTLSARHLYGYIDYLQRNKLDTAAYRLAFWLKITTPLTCLVMLLIVLPFVFGSLRSVSAGQLLVVGILLGLGFYILIQLAARVGQIYGVPPFVSATFPVIFFSIVGVIALMRIR